MSLLGRTIEGRYVVERPLSEGGMGTVWLGRDARLHRAVVVKVPKPELLVDPRFVVRFQREVDALRRLEHPNIIPILDTGTLDGTPYVVMPYLPGGSLAERLAGRPGRRASVGDVVAWLAPIAAALDYLHDHGYVHRDIKPANVLFDAHGRPFLTDFGIAFALETAGTDQRLTQTTSLMPGTPAYMAPEQALKDALTGAADQYALAVTAFEALTGTLPFRGATAIEVLVQKRTGRWVLGPETPVPSASVQALRRAMSSEPAKRFGSCGAFLRALEAQAGPLETDHGPRGASARGAQASAWRHLVPAAVLLVVGLGVIAWLASGQGEDPSGLRPPPAPARAPDPPDPPAGPAAARPPPSVEPSAQPAGPDRPGPRQQAPAPGDTPAAKPARAGAAPAPGTSAPGLTVEEPREGARVNDTMLTVSGTVSGSARVVYVGSRAVPVREGRFSIELELEHEDDGEKTLEIGTTMGQPLVVRRVLLDRSPPRVEVTLRPLGLPDDQVPAQGKDVLYVPEAASYAVRVQVHDVSPVTVRASFVPRLALRPADAPAPGALQELTLDADGVASWTWNRGLLRVATLTLEAADAGDLHALSRVPLVVLPRLGFAFPLERTSPRSGGLWRTFLRLHPALSTDDLQLLVTWQPRAKAENASQEVLSLAGGGWLRELAPREIDQPLQATAELRLVDRGAAAARLPGQALSITHAALDPPALPPAAPQTGPATAGSMRYLVGRQGGLTVPLEASAPMTIEARLKCLDRARPACRFLSGIGAERLDLTLDATGTALTLGSGDRTDSAPKWAFPAPALESWMHLALVLEPERAAAYLNGRLVGTRVRRRAEERVSPREFVLCRPDPEAGAAAREGACTYEIGSLRVTRERRYASEFPPPGDLGLDASTTLLVRPGALDERAWWGQGELGLPAVPAGPGRLLPDPPTARAGGRTAGTALFLSGSGWAFWNVGRAAGDLTLEVRLRRFLSWGQHVVLSSPELDLGLEDGVPVAYARVGDRGALAGDSLRVLSPEALKPGDGWVRLGVARRDREITLFVNGRPMASGTLPAAVDIPTGVWPLGLGGLAGNPPAFVGEVDDVRVSHGARYAGPYDPAVPVAPDADTMFWAGFESDTRPLEGWAPGESRMPNASGGVLLQVPDGEGATQPASAPPTPQPAPARVGGGKPR